MPKNKTGGNNKHKKNKGDRPDDGPLVLASDQPIEEGSEWLYGQVTKKLGGSAFEVVFSDGKNGRALIPGAFKKRVWISVGEVVLVNKTELGYYITHRYSNDHANQLRQKDMIKFADKNPDAKSDDDENGFVFEDI